MTRKQCSGSKMREMTGSGIFAADGGNDTAEIPGSNTQKTGLRIYQVLFFFGIPILMPQSNCCSNLIYVWLQSANSKCNESNFL